MGTSQLEETDDNHFLVCSVNNFVTDKNAEILHDPLEK